MYCIFPVVSKPKYNLLETRSTKPIDGAAAADDDDDDTDDDGQLVETCRCLAK
jgi:hypothetical protein